MECTLMEGQTWGVQGRYAKIMLINEVPIKHSIVSAVMQTIEAHMWSECSISLSGAHLVSVGEGKGTHE